jgi:hypothetical protein
MSKPDPSSDSLSRIFLLSHMRAFTSLIGHILGSHAKINGYYEMHLSYYSSDSLDQQLKLYKKTESIKAHSHYLFDKLLHNCTPSAQVGPNSLIV